MTPQEIERALRQTLADARLSAGEKSALGEILADARLDGQKAAAVRAAAFGLAREEMDGRPREVLGWLEDVVKLLHPVKASSASHEVLFAPFDDVPSRVVRLFASARASADVCVFTITDDRLREAILAAHRRGVRVRVISDDDKAGDLGSDVRSLASAGVPVRFDGGVAHMHHKFAVFDDAVLLNGSYNWTRGAANDNNENVIVTTERLFVDSFAKQFARLWKDFGG